MCYCCPDPFKYQINMHVRICVTEGIIKHAINKTLPNALRILLAICIKLDIYIVMVWYIESEICSHIVQH